MFYIWLIIHNILSNIDESKAKIKFQISIRTVYKYTVSKFSIPFSLLSLIILLIFEKARNNIDQACKNK